MGLISSRFLTQDQLRRCCRVGIGADVIGLTLLTADGRRMGVASDILVDDESLDLRFLIVDTAEAEFPVGQARILLPPDFGRVDKKAGTLRTRASVDQVQSAPGYDPAIRLVTAYEQTAYLDFGERPNNEADH